MIYEQEETEAEEGADFITTTSSNKTEAEEGADFIPIVDSNKMDSLILKDNR
jgi:hypothetical protein